MPSEAELALKISTWLRADGWKTYHEVPMDGGRCDILAVRGPLVWAVETKLRASVEVIYQALDRRSSASVHSVLIGVPWAKTIHKTTKLCNLLGIGLIAVTSSTPKLQVWPDFHRQAKPASLLASLSPFQEDQQAGTTGRSYWTPFKEAARTFLLHLQKHSPLSLAEAVTMPCLTQYKGSRGGSSAIRRWLIWAIETHAIPGCRLEGKGRERQVVFDTSLLPETRSRDLRLHA